MRKCHYIYDKEAGKVLIPYCWSVVHTGKMEDCSCRNGGNTEDETFKQYENRLYRNKIEQYINDKKELSKQITELEKENSSLHRIIKKLCQKK